MKRGKIVGIIPARTGASRFPGKPLAPLLGHPMVEHVYRRSAMCELLDDVYVATCDTVIQKCVLDFGGKAILTEPTHERPSTRVAEAAQGLDADIIVMIQGDEPMIRPEMIEQAVSPFDADPAVQCVNLVKRIDNEQEYRDVNTIKVVMDQNRNALYFSREPIPTRIRVGFENVTVFKQVCIIPFRRECLLRYAELEPTPLELAESIDMLRLLEYGIPVRLVETPLYTHAVDTPADLAYVEALMRKDPLVGRYTARKKAARKK